MLWNQQKPAGGASAPAQDAGFAEIELTEAPSPVKENLFAQKLTLPSAQDDKIRRTFMQMRRLGDQDRSPFGRFYAAGQAQSFYKQAQFMAGFEDDFTEDEPFSMYFPTYQQMSYGQLRTYFTWRTKVRKGIVPRTSFSYVFLYVYELIHSIGFSGCGEGMKRLLFLWNEYRVYEPKLDKYMAQWVRDYYIVNDFTVPFDTFIHQNELLQAYYPLSDSYGAYDRYAFVAHYQFKNSTFYSPEREAILCACFDHVTNKLTAWLGEAGVYFDDLIYYSSRRSVWKPFQKAIYLPGAVPQRRYKTVRISNTEFYWYQDGKWSASQKRVCRTSGRQIIDYVLRRSEQFYRKAEKFKYQLRSDSTKIDFPELNLLPGGKKAFFAQIDAGIVAYYRASKHKPVTVDLQRLEVIRQQSLATQEKLLADLPEEENFSPAPAAPAFEPEPAPVPSLYSDGWSALAALLTAEERTALSLLLGGAGLDRLLAYAQSHGLMLEVLVDSLNQKALNTIEDNLIELSDTLSVYEEYESELERVIGIETN